MLDFSSCLFNKNKFNIPHIPEHRPDATCQENFNVVSCIQRTFSQKHHDLAICIWTNSSAAFLSFPFQKWSAPRSKTNGRCNQAHIWPWRLAWKFGSFPLFFVYPFSLSFCWIWGWFSSCTYIQEVGFLIFATIVTGSSSCLEMVLRTLLLTCGSIIFYLISSDISCLFFLWLMFHVVYTIRIST